MMDRIEEYKKVKDDQVQGKGKTKVSHQNREILDLIALDPTG